MAEAETKSKIFAPIPENLQNTMGGSTVPHRPVQPRRKVQPRRLQHPAQLSRNCPNAKSSNSQHYVPFSTTQSSSQTTEGEMRPVRTEDTDQPETFYRNVPRKSSNTRTIDSSGSGPIVQPRRTSLASRTDDARKPSDITFERLSKPRHVTPKRTQVQRASKVQRDMESQHERRNEGSDNDQRPGLQRDMESPQERSIERPDIGKQGVKAHKIASRAGRIEKVIDNDERGDDLRPECHEAVSRAERMKKVDQEGFDSSPEGRETVPRAERIKKVPMPPELHANRVDLSSYDPYAGLTSFLGWESGRQRAMEREIMSLRTRLGHSQKKNDELTYNLSDLSRANDSLQADIRSIQQKSFNQMTKSAWTPLEDRVIQDVLDEIHQDLEAWAEDNCVESLADLISLDDTEHARLLEVCKSVAVVTQDDLLTQLEWWHDRHVDPILLLTALVAHRMYTCIFSNEFVALRSLDAKSTDTMFEVYQKLAELDFKQAQVWRSQMMRIILDSPPSSGNFDGLKSKLDVPGLVRRVYDEAIDDFQCRPEAAFLKGKISVESRENLLSCWTKAAELFVQLQTQVPLVRWSATDRLNCTVNPRFVESHRSQAFPKGRNDGKTVSLVISPMVAIFGNEDGERYDDWRAVCKATILVIDEELESESEDASEVSSQEEEVVSSDEEIDASGALDGATEPDLSLIK